MGYYDWAKILESQSDSELKSIVRDRSREDSEKVNASIEELKKRGLIDEDEKFIHEKQESEVFELGLDLKTRSNKQRAEIAIIAIWIVLGTTILTLISSIAQYILIISIENGKSISIQQIENNDLRVSIVAIFQIIMFSISVIVFIFWFRRAYYNLHCRISNCSYKEGWAVGSWFVPILFLFRPFQIMKELWEKTNTIQSERDKNNDIDASTKILGIWWTLWIIRYLLTYIFVQVKRFNSEDELIIETIQGMIISVIFVFLSFITIKLIKTYSKREEIMYQQERQAANFPDLTSIL